MSCTEEAGDSSGATLTRVLCLMQENAGMRPTATPTPLAPAATVLPSFSPLYRQIKTALGARLQAGEWLPGQAIPSEQELAAHYKASQGTVRKAIDEMAADNLLVRRQGKGTFVATHAEALTQYRFLRLAPDDGSPPALQRRLLDCRRQRAPAEVARLLALKAGEPALQVRRLLLDGRTPVVFDDLWLPGTAFKGLTAERLSAWRGPLYQLFEEEFLVHMVRAEEKIRAVAATPDEAQLLTVAPGQPLLSVSRLSFTYGDRPVELRRGLYHTAAYHYRNQLN
jgi:GntR family transcriptional regulator